MSSIIECLLVFSYLTFYNTHIGDNKSLQQEHKFIRLVDSLIEYVHTFSSFNTSRVSYITNLKNMK